MSKRGWRGEVKWKKKLKREYNGIYVCSFIMMLIILCNNLKLILKVLVLF